MSPSATSQFRFPAGAAAFSTRRVGSRNWMTLPAIVALFAGLLTNVRFQFGGLVSAGETVLAVVAILAVVAHISNPRFWNRRVALILFALSISFLGYVLSDLINATPAERLIRGWARMAFVILDFIGIWALARKSMVNLFAVCAGDALSTLLSYFLEPRHDFFFDYKFHLAVPVTLFVIVAIPRITSRRWASVATGMALAVLGSVHIRFDNRLAGGICMLIGFVLIARAITSSRLRTLYLILLVLAVTMSSLAIGYIYSATDASFADRRQGSNSYRLSAAWAGIDAIKRSPVVGLGSWVWDPGMWNTFSARMGRSNIVNYSSGDTMGPHSQIIQAWAEAGVLGVLFFIYYGKLLMESLWTLFFRRPLDNMTPLFLFYLLLALWDLILSPFANLHRFHIALGLVISIHMLSARAERRAIAS